MSRVYTYSISRNKIIFVCTSLFLLVTGSAFGLSVGNSPDTGYLLCSNIKTHAVIYPAKLSCPSGYSNLQLGAQGPAGQSGSEGIQGSMGPVGPQGPSGSSISQDLLTSYFIPITSQDIVADGVTSGSNLKNVILAKILPTTLPFAAYNFVAHVRGLWADSALTQSEKPFVECYFQYSKSYPTGSERYGGAKADLVNWSGIFLNIYGDAWFTTSADDPIYLVCRTSGSIKGLAGSITASPSTLVRVISTAN